MSPIVKSIANRINLIISITLVFLVGNLYSQGHVPGLVGRNFIAMTVADANSTSVWYENVFGVKLLKEIKTADGAAYGRIEGSEFIMVEILQLKDSKTLIDCNLSREQSHLLQGFFKVGLFVEDIDKAEQYFKSNGIKIKHPVFRDKETATRSFILEDPNGNMLQFLQDENAGQTK